MRNVFLFKLKWGGIVFLKVDKILYVGRRIFFEYFIDVDYVWNEF